MGFHPCSYWSLWPQAHIITFLASDSSSEKQKHVMLEISSTWGTPWVHEVWECNTELMKPLNDYWVGIFPGCIKVRDMRLLQSVGPVLLTLDLAFSNPKPKWLLRLALHLFKPALASAASQPNFSTFLLVVITTLWGKYYFFILRIKKKIRLKEVKHSIFHSWWVA